MKRLAIVRQKYNPAGGAERIVSAILRQLRGGGGLRPLLITRNWEAVDGIEAARVKPFYLGSVWRDWGFARAARRAWREAGADLVQSHERIPGCDIFRAGDGVHAAWLEARLEGKTWLARLATFCNPYHHYMLRTERAMFLHPSLRAVICNSELVRNDVTRRFGVPAARCEVIYNGVDSAFFHPREARRTRAELRERYGIEQDAPVLVYVGSGFERKGVAQALNAIAAHPSVRLVVVGGDKKLARYRRLAETLGIGGRVRFVGPQRDVRGFYGMADGFILPTLYEPFGSVVAEAMACGLPVLTSARCGGAELLEEGETGWVAPALDAGHWQRNVASWLASRGRWSEMGDRARARVEALSEESMVAQMLALYRRLLSEREGRR
ncbi:glycosyl transferase family 1 [Chromobacterium phragmitis]|uniref:Glycosyltransferase family 4 protein n=1 Tax=Chromobacterium phragmitis TaxID=2202141 RepID=A0ABV0IZ80_9NEIS|nr:glycosyltransferase family 4 protein [Chromobacterium phragmitis]AXE29362.1 glycosyl transferase family 1 [Chromobacterium phragmitis]